MNFIVSPYFGAALFSVMVLALAREYRAPLREVSRNELKAVRVALAFAALAVAVALWSVLSLRASVSSLESRIAAIELERQSAQGK